MILKQSACCLLGISVAHIVIGKDYFSYKWCICSSTSPTNMVYLWDKIITSVRCSLVSSAYCFRVLTCFKITEAAGLSSAISEKYACQWPALSTHTHSYKHRAMFFPASDVTQPRLFLFHRLIAPTEDHWFYGKPCLQAECHRPEVTFCLLQLEQYWSGLMSALAE